MVHYTSMTRTPQTRSENLFHYFGWQGGTIHQIADETGVDVQTLLYADPSETYLSSKYSHGAAANETCTLSMRLKLAKEAKGMKDYWIGVAFAIRPLAHDDVLFACSAKLH